MDKINLLQIISTAEVGGGEQHLLYIADKLNKNKYNLFFACPHEGEFASDLRNKGYSPLVLKMRSKFSFSVITQIKKFMQENKIQVVHTHGMRMGFYGGIAARLACVPAIVYTVHISTYDYPVTKGIKWFYLFLDNLTLRFSDRIICVSDSLASELRKRIPQAQDKISVINNGIDLNRFSLSQDTASLAKELNLGLRPIIGAIGRLVDYKGPAYLLEATKELLNLYPDITCIFVGDGPLRASLENLAAKLGIFQHCRFLGNRKDIPQILSILDVLVLPSLSEGKPLILLEAMAMQKPIVATSIAGVTELITDGKNGLLVEPKNPFLLAGAIKQILDDPQRGKKLAEQGRATVEQYYTVEQMVGKLEDLYETVLREKIK